MMNQRQDARPELQRYAMNTQINKRFGIQQSSSLLQIYHINEAVAQHQHQFPTEYIGNINDQDNKEIIKQLKFSYVKWFAKSNCFALGYNKVNSQKRQGHYSIFDLNDWKLYYKKFAQDEAMVGLLSQEYMNKILGIGSQGGIYMIEKMQEKLEQRPVITTDIKDITDATFSPNHSKIAFSSSDKQIYIYDVNTNQKECLIGHGKEVLTLNWNPTYSLIASGSEDETIRLWDPLKKEEITSLKRHNLGVRKIKWNRTGQLFLSAAKDKQTMVFDIRKVETELFKLPQNSESIFWHPRYDNIFLVGDQQLSGWNCNAPGQPIFQQKKPDTIVTDMAIDNLGIYMAVIRAKVDKSPDSMEVFKTP